MCIIGLTIGNKVTNNGSSNEGRLTSDEFNELVAKVNELVDNANKKIYCTQDEYDELLSNGLLQNDVEYNIYEE